MTNTLSSTTEQPRIRHAIIIWLSQPKLDAWKLHSAKLEQSTFPVRYQVPGQRYCEDENGFTQVHGHLTDLSGITSVEDCQAGRCKAAMAKDNSTDQKRTSNTAVLMYSKSFQDSGKDRGKVRSK